MDEILGHNVPDLMFGRDSVSDSEAAAAIDRVRAGESVVLDHARYGDGGAMIWINETISPIVDADGAVTAIVSVATDITERRRNEEALRDARGLLEDMSKIADVGGWDLDLTTQTLRWTEHTKAIHGVSPAYIPDLATAIEFYAPEARGHVQAAVAHTIATGEPYAFEHPLIRADGERRWVRATVASTCPAASVGSSAPSRTSPSATRSRTRSARTSACSATSPRSPASAAGNTTSPRRR